jgi:hypothetical protein
MTDTMNTGTQPTVTPNPDQLEGDYDARAVKLLRVRRRVGIGSIEDPVRIVVSLWTEAGEVIFEMDPNKATSEREQLLVDGLGDALDKWEGLVESSCDGLSQDGRLAAIRRIAQLRRLIG